MEHERNNRVDNRQYCSFLLSLKQVETEDVWTWIVALRNVHTGNQQIFSNLNGLIEFLQAEFGNGAELQDLSTSSVQDVQVF